MASYRQKSVHLRYHGCVMVSLGVAITAATVAILVAEFLRNRKGPCQCTAGWVAGAGLRRVADVRGVEPVATFFTPIAWTAYILVADAAVLAVQGESRLRNAPREFARTALLSCRCG